MVTDGLGLVTLLVATTSAASVLDPDLSDAVGTSAPVLIVLGSVLIGGICGSLLRIEDRLEGMGDAIRRRVPHGRGGDRDRFVEGFVTASLVFCVGPLTILGSLDDGLGRGIDKLALKATLDGFAAIAFAASLGWGVAASALVVLVVQGSLTLLGAAAGRSAPRRPPGRAHRDRWAAARGGRPPAAPDPAGSGCRPPARPGSSRRCLWRSSPRCADVR